MRTVGNGPDKPIDSNDTPEGREKNRRTDIKVYPNPAATVMAGPTIIRKPVTRQSQLILGLLRGAFWCGVVHPDSRRTASTAGTA